MNVSERAEATRIACWQPEWVTGRSQRDEFLDRLSAAATEAASGGAVLLITPEMSATGYHLGRARTSEVAEPPGGPLAAASRDRPAHRRGDRVRLPRARRRRRLQRVQLVGAGGAVAANYRKTHLFGDFDRAAFAARRPAVVQADLGGAPVGLLICYDVEFPETVRAHALAGTDLLVVPTALMRPYAVRRPDRSCPRAPSRASCSSRTPTGIGAGRGLRYCGELSAVAGPDGLPRSAPAAEDGASCCSPTPTRRLAASAAEPVSADRRPDLYGLADPPEPELVPHAARRAPTSSTMRTRAQPPITMFGPDFPFAYDDFLAPPRRASARYRPTEHGTEVAVIGGGLSGSSPRTS